jgi:uncharacterized membrane protein
MPTAESLTLRIHIAAGFVALLAGLVALATEKGGQRHRTAGKVYVLAMGVVVGTVFPLLAFDPDSFFRQFLALVAVFSGYFAFSGYRVLARKRPADGGEPVDVAAAILVTTVTLVLGGWGVWLVVAGDTFGVVMVVFGTLGLSLGVGDLRRFLVGEAGGERWLVDHLGRMLGAYIATVTAVSVVNLTMVPRVVAWLWPTAVGVPLIWYWQYEYTGTGPFARLASD